ncbi:MAG: InlB B-repeat-containing protein [Lachnospiraceae bacterium]|nr:InlB B-repeat-containing protein [Lachnospiraceae bacterium]
MKKILRRILCFVLVLSMVTGNMPAEAFASTRKKVYLPEIAIGNDILDHDVFYIATASAMVQENGDCAYLLRIGRGGSAEGESSVLVKIADMTAKYSEDYVVRIHDGSADVENPEDNFSLMEMIEGSDFEQNTISDDEKVSDMLTNDPDARAAYQEGIENALDFLEEASGLNEKYGDEDPYAEAVESVYGDNANDKDVADEEKTSDTDENVIPANGDDEVITIEGEQGKAKMSLRDAANLFTGQSATSQRLTNDSDMIQDIQSIANVMTNVVVGAKAELTFAPGETEKYLEIVPKDNNTGDGDRMFYIILGAPSGTTTNSSASSCAITIVDDEESEPAVVNFSEAVYHADPDKDSIDITVKRSGIMSTVISVGVKTTGEGTAQMGRDYSEVNTELVFPFGVDHLTVNIPIRTEYLTGEGSFNLELTNGTGCTVGDISVATVYLDGTYTGKESLRAAEASEHTTGMSKRMAASPGHMSATSALKAATPVTTAMNTLSAPAATDNSTNTTLDRNNLGTVKTLSAIDLSKPFDHGNRSYSHSSTDQYANGVYQLMWKGKWQYGVGVIFELTKDYWESYFLAGAKVKWNRTSHSNPAIMKVAIAGKSLEEPEGRKYLFNIADDDGYYNRFAVSSLKDSYTDEMPVDYHSKNYVDYFSYLSDRNFSTETRYIYPHENAVIPEKQGSLFTVIKRIREENSDRQIWGLTDKRQLFGEHPQAIEIINHGRCTDCNILYIQEISPILRPFQVNVYNNPSLTYLMADGTHMAINTDTSSEAELVEAGSSGVFFKDDSFTVKTTAASNVSQYSYMSALSLLNDNGEVLSTLGTNDDPSNTSITYTLNNENMEKLIKEIDPGYADGSTSVWASLLKQNTFLKECDGYATYARFDVRPEFSYIDASVTLRNPYDFPVTITISGTDYTLSAKETRKIKAPDEAEFHRGDTLAISKITIDPLFQDDYTPVGIRYWAKFNSTSAKWDKDGTWNFIDYDIIHVSGTYDGRLNFGETIIEPNLQVKDNCIRVKVKTDDLKYFDTSIVKDANGNVTHHAGVLATEGIVDGEYTTFLFADSNVTVNGRIYAITATPKDDNKVCVWKDKNSLRFYEGNTLYFVAGIDPGRNVIELSLENATTNYTFSGTLRYTNYNLRAGYEGKASDIPAVGATVAFGSAGGSANSDGYVSVGPVKVSGKGGNRYLRYIVSINGNDFVKECQISDLSFYTGVSMPNMDVDISTLFPGGVSPIGSEIFKDIQISGAIVNMNGKVDNSYKLDSNSYIPIVTGKIAKLTVNVKPHDYKYSITGENGNLLTDTETENPISVQLVLYDSNDVLKNVYDVVDDFKWNPRTKTYTFTCPIEFVEPDTEEQYVEIPVFDSDGNPAYDADGNPITKKIDVTSSGNLPKPGDKLYLRLVTDRLAQADRIRSGDDAEIIEFRYSDIFTGFYFNQPVGAEQPPEMGIKDPITIEYGNLPLIGNTGMDLAFPFVSVGIIKIKHGYRIYIGVSPVQIMDTIKGTHVSSTAGAGGEYWKSLFSIKDPFGSFANGLSTAAETIGDIRDAAKSAKANGESFSAASLGSPSWKFDLSVGMYFDFINTTVTYDGGQTQSYFVFNGMGGYVSITLGFSMAWYIVLPVVFLPAYFGIEIQGTVMGFLGATMNKDVKITYDDSMNGSANINDGITSLNGSIRGSAYIQLSLGVGLCGTLGVRVSGKVNFIANWDPGDENGSWGFYIGIQAGLIIDLFLFSIPLMYSFPGWAFGSFEYYSNPEKWTSTQDNPDSRQKSLQLRTGSGDDSMWLGDQMMVRGAFKPNKDKVQTLALDPYERPDSQLITLSDGSTLALAFIDSDNSKGITQRTTLKISIYDADTGSWSTPVPVSADDTADFQPSIAETRDGKLLVAWVSTGDASITDLSTEENIKRYLNGMEVYTAFVELAGKAVKTRHDVTYDIDTVDTEITRITNDYYYDANPSVVCDPRSGDAIVYYIKSDRDHTEGKVLSDCINPYTNDSVVMYMVYNAEEDVDTWTTSKGESKSVVIPAGWLFNNYYHSEMDHDENGLNEDELLEKYEFWIEEFRGQRFLDGPVNDKNESYAIPDFTAIGYDNKAVCAYTIDPDGSSDTDADKEIYLQVYNFADHRTMCQLALTDDEYADAMPQFFHSRVNTGEGEETHTKLFWYKYGKQVVYLDINELLEKGVNYGTGIDTRGSLKTEENGGEPDEEYTFTINDVTYYKYTNPQVVWFVNREETDSNAMLSGADFKVVEDSKGNLYVLWTESVTDGDGNAAQEIFGTGLVGYAYTDVGQDGNEIIMKANSGWSKPYQITRDGFQNDEIAVAMSGENLIVVHNRFKESLKEVPDGKEYRGQVDFMPIEISNMALISNTLEPCGSVETESVKLYYVDNVTYTNDNGEEKEAEHPTLVTKPMGGEKVRVEVEVSNNGMNTAEGYRLSLYAVDKAGNETPIGEIETTEYLVPNRSRTHSYDFILPADVDGLTFKTVSQEMRDASTKLYYNDKDEYVSEPLTAEAFYVISGISTYQSEDGFSAKFSVTNNGNAASGAGDKVNIQLWGPANLSDIYPDEKGCLYSESISLGIGETKEFEVPVSILPEMMSDYGFITARIDVEKEVVEQTLGSAEYKGTRYLSDLEYVDFDLVIPMNMTLSDISVEVDDKSDIGFSMKLGNLFRGGDAVTYAVDDLTVARIEDGKVVGMNGGTTTLYATHTGTGATVSSTVTVTGERETVDIEIASESMELTAGDNGIINYYTSHNGTVTFTSSNTQVAIVNEFGEIRAVYAGSATITVTVKDDETGKEYTKTCEITVKSVPKPYVPADPVVNTYTVSFDANEGKGNMESLSTCYSVTLTANSFTREGYSFVGWNTKADGSGISYKDKDTVTTYADIVLYAQWEKDEAEISPDPKPVVEKDRITAEESKKAAIDINAGLKVYPKGSSIVAKWGKVGDADRYVVYAAYCKKGRKCVKVATLDGDVNSYKITELNGKPINTKKNVKVYVVAYRNVNGKYKKIAKSIVAHIVGASSKKYSNVKAIQVEKTRLTLSVDENAAAPSDIQLNPTAVLKDSTKKMLLHTAEFRYATSNSSVATVSKDGTITAKETGTCYIYVYAQNGYAKRVKVKVK